MGLFNKLKSGSFAPPDPKSLPEIMKLLRFLHNDFGQLRENSGE